MKKTLILLASYNGEAYILQQIESILIQKDVDFELWVVDDNSSDSTVKIVNSFKDGRIKIFTNSVSSGSAALNFLNFLIQKKEEIFKNFQYVALSDQDDIWSDDKLKHSLEKLNFHSASLYSSDLIVWLEKSNTKFTLKKSLPQKKYDFLFEGGSAGCTYVFSVDFYVDFIERISTINLEDWKFLSHDWLIYFYARLTNAKVIIDDVAKIHYRIHGNNVHGQMNLSTIVALKKRLSLVREGWYIEQIKGFKQILDENSIENKIYNLYQLCWFSRLWVLIRYNFNLMRSKRKFFVFAIVSLIPQRSISG